MRKRTTHSQKSYKQGGLEVTNHKKSDKTFDFRTLSNQILNYAHRGVLRFDFLREVCRMLANFARCDMVELHLRESGKYFICEAKRHTEPCSHLEFTLSVEKIPASFKTGESDEYRSTVSIPLLVGDETIGILQLHSKYQRYFKKEETELYKSIGQTLGVALAYRNALVSLRERIKELTCLYGIAKLVVQPGISLAEILEGIAKLLPPAWLYPEIASARIFLDGNSYSTPNFREGKDKITADIIISGERRGWVEVTYSEERPYQDEGPFLKEERHLLDAVAKEIALIIERRKVDEERLKLEEQLRHADRLATIGQLAAGVAHELNEPLSTILGFAQLIKKSPQLPESISNDVEKIIKASLHAREVIKKLMLFARQMPPKKTKINFNKVVEDGLYFLEFHCSKVGIEVVKKLSPDLPEITGDPSQLHQVLVNLVVNAIQAMPEGGRLTIQTFATDDHVSLIVEDTGQGMSEEVKSKIFTPFWTTKEVGQGTGLGLSVVHGIVTAHGGLIKVESKIGQGSKFEIQLPIGRGDEIGLSNGKLC